MSEAKEAIVITRSLRNDPETLRMVISGHTNCSLATLNRLEKNAAELGPGDIVLEPVYAQSNGPKGFGHADPEWQVRGAQPHERVDAPMKKPTIADVLKISKKIEGAPLDLENYHWEDLSEPVSTSGATFVGPHSSQYVALQYYQEGTYGELAFGWDENARKAVWRWTPPDVDNS